MKYSLQSVKVKILTQWEGTHGQKSLKQAVEDQVPPELSLLAVVRYGPETEVGHTGKGRGQQNPGPPKNQRINSDFVECVRLNYFKFTT